MNPFIGFLSGDLPAGLLAIDLECQDHIKAMKETRILFNDVEEVAMGSGVNLLTGKQEQVPEVDFLSAGTSCVNLSSENLGSLG